MSSITCNTCGKTYCADNMYEIKNCTDETCPMKGLLHQESNAPEGSMKILNG